MLFLRVNSVLMRPVHPTADNSNSNPCSLALIGQARRISWKIFSDQIIGKCVVEFTQAATLRER
jgi:hypothetical protein